MKITCKIFVKFFTIKTHSDMSSWISHYLFSQYPIKTMDASFHQPQVGMELTRGRSFL